MMHPGNARRSDLSGWVQMRFDSGHSSSVRPPRYLLGEEREPGALDKQQGGDADEDADTDVLIAPVSGPKATEILAQLEEPVQIEPEEIVQPDARFSIKQLLLITVLASLAFSSLQWVPPEVCAGVAGLASLVGMVILAVAQPMSPVPYFCWWSLLAVYAIASGIAMFTV